MANGKCASCTSPSRSLSSNTHSESVASASDSEHEPTSYASSSLGHLRPPPRKKGKSKGQESPTFLSLVGVFDVVYKNTEIRLCAYRLSLQQLGGYAILRHTKMLRKVKAFSNSLVSHPQKHTAGPFKKSKQRTE